MRRATGLSLVIRRRRIEFNFLLTCSTSYRSIERTRKPRRNIRYPPADSEPQHSGINRCAQITAVRAAA